MNPIDTQERIYPVPEIFPEELGRGWKIRHTKKWIGIDHDERTIHVPLDGQPVSHCLKLQQIARIKWDDATVNAKGLDSHLLFRAVEDHRLSCLLTRAGIDIGAGFLYEQTLGLLQSLPDDAFALTLLLMSDYTGNAPTLAFLTRNQDDRIVRLFLEIRRRIAENPTKANTVAIVRWLRTLVRDVPLPTRLKIQGKRKGCPTGSCQLWDGTPMDFDDYFELAWDELDEDMKLQELPSAVRAQLPRDVPESMIPMRTSYEQLPDTFVPWGTPRLEEPPRPVDEMGKFHKRWKATEEGVLPRYPHRSAVDQRIFARRWQVPGGTVVIDSSGSMGLTPEAIKRMVEHAPGCVVANYSGDEQDGIIRILAKGGRRVPDSLCAAPSGGGNIVDYHALRWAYKQSHPRIWVSDLGVTGIGDQPGKGNFAMCLAAVKKGRFFHAHDVDEAIAVLKRLGRFYRKA